jgi:hypothetical protein
MKIIIPSPVNHGPYREFPDASDVIVLDDNGTRIEGVCSIDIRIRLGQPTRATLEFFGAHGEIAVEVAVEKQR